MKLLKECKTCLIISALVLIIPVLHIADCIVNGRIFTGYLVIIPLAVFALTFSFSLITKIPDTARIVIISIVTVLALLGTGFVRMLFGNVQFKANYGEKAATGYEQYCDTLGLDCGSYEDVNSYIFRVNTFFPSSSDTYIIKYNDADFEEAKNKIDTTVKFYKEPLIKGGPIPEFSLDGFDFRMMVTENDYYPKWMKFIGINNFTKEIAFVDFSMIDLDGVWDFTDLMMHDGGWRRISEERAS